MSSTENRPVIELANVQRVYRTGKTEVAALRGVDLTVMPGEMIAIMGSSGSGKSTLMNTLGCLDVPTGGSYTLDGIRVESLGRDSLADLRNQKLGFVFQGFNLLARTSALDNVELPLLYDRRGRWKGTRAMAAAALERVGLGGRLDHEPSELSGGQQQRVAIARALVTQPTLLLADEPTGNLDSRTTIEIMALFQELNDEGVTIVLVTHEPEVAQYARRVVEVRDGRILRDHPVDDRRRAADDLAAMDAAAEYREAA
ncbi:ABC transporter ATP-binding protein [Longimicrobium terrae]|uniref:Putative ABC transport system ATP-binding protein n=1 Tax=Longimicrobium terrae TaxID=1639882 RepID=A0A841H0Z7_9BACT|nr:ABC transporter ATP-binding protein [Longimicrobium terrae]MBB4637367.1 putative ABC transport system ATP-binding protein [Longimicrobium terrae]MBB6071765.1 putative ABC transport system ATP-binding protein [Longimicrobium terrae]NNC28525.1 ABC transporter ATP-binding protein [Longimicrobium terrae]